MPINRHGVTSYTSDSLLNQIETHVTRYELQIYIDFAKITNKSWIDRWF